MEKDSADETIRAFDDLKAKWSAFCDAFDQFRVGQDARLKLAESFVADLVGAPARTGDGKSEDKAKSGDIDLETRKMRQRILSDEQGPFVGALPASPAGGMGIFGGFLPPIPTSPPKPQEALVDTTGPSSADEDVWLKKCKSFVEKFNAVAATNNAESHQNMLLILDPTTRQIGIVQNLRSLQKARQAYKALIPEATEIAKAVDEKALKQLEMSIDDVEKAFETYSKMPADQMAGDASRSLIWAETNKYVLDKVDTINSERKKVYDQTNSNFDDYIKG